jgi:hypothetical protein
MTDKKIIKQGRVAVYMLVPPEFHAAVREAAFGERTSITGLIRRLTQDYLRRKGYPPYGVEPEGAAKKK